MGDCRFELWRAHLTLPVAEATGPLPLRPEGRSRANIRTPLLRQSQPDAEMVGDGEDVLVAAAAHVHDDQMVARQGRRDLGDVGQRMRRLERRDDAFEPARQLKRLERLVGR